MRDYTALEDFETPDYGVITKGDTIALPDATAALWLKAGLVEEKQTVNLAPIKSKVKEV